MRTYDLIDDAFNALEAGQVEAVINDCPVSKYAERAHKDLAVVQAIQTNEQYGIAFPKGSDTLRKAVNKELAKLRDDGDVAEDLQQVVRSRALQACTRADPAAEPARTSGREGRQTAPFVSRTMRLETATHRRRRRWASSSTSTSTSTSSGQLQLRAGGLRADAAAVGRGRCARDVWGLVLALLRQSPGRPMMPVRGLAIAYIDVMRGIPLLLVILLISGSIPFLTFLPMWLAFPDFFGKPDIFWFGVLSITLTYGAYYAEVYRSGLEGVPYGQTEAARSLGMSHAQVDAARDRPAGGPTGDPTDAERLHRAHEGHLARPGDRTRRGRAGRPRGAGGDVQQLGPHARRADVHRRDDSARAASSTG